MSENPTRLTKRASALANASVIAAVKVIIF